MSARLLREAAEAIRADAPALDEDRSWHPAVALAVADLLDREVADQSKRLSDLRSAFGEAGDDFMPSPDPLLVALATTYLREVTP